MGTDALGVMNAVRVRQGREPINPYTIEGFGAGDPPPPPIADLPDIVTPDAPGANDDDEFGIAQHPSPLVPVTYQAPAPARVEPSPGVPAPDLMVADRQAVFQGTAVELDELDVKAIATVVLRAAQRKMAAQLTALVGKRTRQRRAVGVKPESEQPAIPAAPRKRGRPKGSKNKVKANGAANAVSPAAPA